MSNTTRRTMSLTDLLAEVSTDTRTEEHVTFAVFSTMHASSGDYGLGAIGSYATAQEARKAAEAHPDEAHPNPAITYSHSPVKRTVTKFVTSGLNISTVYTPVEFAPEPI